MSHNPAPPVPIMEGVRESCSINHISPESLLPETARFPGGPFLLSDAAPDLRLLAAAP